MGGCGEDKSKSSIFVRYTFNGFGRIIKKKGFCENLSGLCMKICKGFDFKKILCGCFDRADFISVSKRSFDARN